VSLRGGTTQQTLFKGSLLRQLADRDDAQEGVKVMINENGEGGACVRVSLKAKPSLIKNPAFAEPSFTYIKVFTITLIDNPE